MHTSIRALLCFAGLCFVLIGSLCIVTFPDAMRHGSGFPPSHIVRASYIACAFIMLFAGCIVCTFACKAPAPEQTPEQRIAQLRRSLRRATFLRATFARSLQCLAVLTVCACALGIGAASAALGILSADPNDLHGYRAAIAQHDYCYAAFGIACHPNTFRHR